MEQALSSAHAQMVCWAAVLLVALGISKFLEFDTVYLFIHFNPLKINSGSDRIPEKAAS